MIATNLATRVDPTRVGMVAWAMNVGGIGELGFGPHRAPDAPGPHRGASKRATPARRLSRDRHAPHRGREEEGVPDGRFAFLGRFFPLIMRG